MPDADPFAPALGAAPALLARLLGARGTWADLFVERSAHVGERLVVTARPRRVDAPRRRAAAADVAGAALRVLVDGAERFAAVEDDAPAALRAAADALAAAGPARHAAPVPLAHRDPAPEPFAAAERAAWLERAADAALGLGADVGRVEAAVRVHRRHVLVAGTGDGPPTAAVTAAHLLALRVDVVLHTGAGTAMAYAVHGAAERTAFLARTPEDVAAEAVARARTRAAARPLPPGAWPVVVAPGWGGVWMHEAVGHRFEADVLARAPLPDGPVAPPGVTFHDDPTRPGGRGTFAYDDEAAPARPLALVRDGRAVGALADRRRGGAGRGRRQDFRHPPLPRSTNLVLAPGPDDPAALVADVRDGLYVAGVADGFVVPEADRFGFTVVEGWRIEGGRLTHPVADVRVEGSLRAALLAIDGVGGDVRLDAARGLCRKDGQVVPVSVAAPTVRFARLTVRPA